jgi:hypothetical protein
VFESLHGDILKSLEGKFFKLILGESHEKHAFCATTQHLLCDGGKMRKNHDGVGWLQEVLDP